MKWRRLISCMGITPDEIFSQIRYALLLWKHSAEKPLECLLRVSMPQWWVYDIWLAIEVTMFTGIVEEVGHVARIEQHGEDRRLTITASNTPKELNPGDSVAVSGVCLTAVNISAGSFCADLAPETWARTSFSRMHEGALVNLELPMKANGRFGGHIVQGHVDGVGKLIGLERIAESGNWWLQIELPRDVEKYTVYKGSLCIEGISLTVARLDGTSCIVAIIPHTVEKTNLNSLHAGDSVNLEADLIAKYVEKMMATKPPESSLTVEELVGQGF